MKKMTDFFRKCLVTDKAMDIMILILSDAYGAVFSRE